MSSRTPQTSIWELLDQAQRSVNRRLARHLAESGHPAVRASHGAVFENIAPKGSRITDMAERAGITKQSMSQFVLELEEHGYVDRSPDASDGRAKLVRLTSKGREAVSFAFRGLEQLHHHVEASIGTGDLETLRRLLAKFAEALTDR